MNGNIASSTYHSILRIALCVVALTLVFDSGLISQSTTMLSTSAQDYVASAVGVKVGVAPNEINQLTGRITELEQELALKEREIAINLGQSKEESFDTSTFILSTILFVLLVLIVLNYALDYIRFLDNRRDYAKQNSPA